MKRAYFGVFAILLVSLAAFASASFFAGDEMEDLGLAKASFPKTLFGSDAGDQLAAKKTAVPEKKVKDSKKAKIDTTSKCILFIGDSMLEGLSPRLAAYAEVNGDKLNSVIWYSSSTEWWAVSGRVTMYIKKYKPDYIFICLGGNELFVRNIKEKRTKYVKQIVSEFGDIPYIWIGPPNWKDDTGYNEMVQSVVPKGRFYLSYTPDQHYDRSKDGAHPTRPSAYKWMDRVCKWVMEKSDSPIRLKEPQKVKANCHTEYLSPKLAPL